MTAKEAMKLALEAIEFELSAGSPAEEEYASMLLCDARAALKKSLAEQPAPMSQPNRVISYAAAMKLRELGYEWMNDEWKHLDELAEQPAPVQQEPMADGMTLRDYFAAKAMEALMMTEIDVNGAWQSLQVAGLAYEQANVMLHMRAQAQPARQEPLTEQAFEALYCKAKGYVQTGLMDVVRIVEHHHNIREKP